jgi:FkbM family methyltransferase
MSSSSDSEFLTHFTAELIDDAPRRWFDNVDRERFGSGTGRRGRDRVLALAASLGFYRTAPLRRDILNRTLSIRGLDRAYGLLADSVSRDLFVKLLAYRILGDKHVRLPLNDRKYWELRRSVRKHRLRRNTIKDVPILRSLDLFDFNRVRLHAHTMNILNTFLLRQYNCDRGGIGAKPSDVVIDAGGCWGDTALYFAAAGARVFCFECIPSNIRIIEDNLSMNSDLAAEVSVVQKALWDSSGEILSFADAGPGSRPASRGSGVEVESCALDDFVSANRIERVDLVKMDIEGAEPRALAGAEGTIRRDRPQLAISLYHDVEHFASIPGWIADLNLGYRFYLDHFTIHAEETVLFARANLPASNPDS